MALRFKKRVKNDIAVLPQLPPKMTLNNDYQIVFRPDNN